MSVREIKQSYLSKSISKATFIERMFQEHKRLYLYSELIRESEIKSIHIEHGRIVFEDIKGVLIASSVPDQRSAPIETINFGSYESNEIEVMIEVINDGDCILDIGGNIGWHAIIFSKSFPNSDILTFEPVPFVYDDLCANIELNECKNIRAFNFAFSDSQADLPIYYDPDYSARSSARNLSESARPPLSCRSDTLDAFAERTDLGKVNVIKCDVEGGELLAFRGGQSLIARDKPAVFAEMLRKWTAKFEYTPNDIIALMRSIGYFCFELGGDSPVRIEIVDDTTVGTNFLFLHPDNHDDLITNWS